MINSEKIGIGIVTYNRSHLLKKLLNSLKNSNFDELIIVNDGAPIQIDSYGDKIHQNKTNIGVGKSKNIALKYLLDKKCDHYFLIEDDIYLKDPEAFSKYIDASKKSGIQHFNFSQHGMMNKSFDGTKTPTPRLIVAFNDVEVALYPHCVGAFSYYSKKCLDAVGVLDEQYFNACEHVDHTYEIIKAGMHPNFWYFADINESWKYIGDEEWSIQNSTISSSPNHQQIMKDADVIFVKKHGCLPGNIMLASEIDVLKSLKQIKKEYGNCIF